MKALPRSAAWSRIAPLVLIYFAGCGSTQSSERDADAPLLASHGCRTQPERCNAHDDDCDGIIDEDADSSCGLAHAFSSCIGGTCVLDRCANGYFDCNQSSADGCETELACAACTQDCAPSERPARSMSGKANKPDAGSVRQPSQPAQPGEASLSVDDADGGEPHNPERQLPDTESDAGVSCEAERCDGQDNDCDHKVDEDTTCTCADSAPTGQGADCDRCVCESCSEALAACTGTLDDEWNMLCGAVLTCFGKSIQAGLCTGEDSDCFQNGDGPCATEFRSAFRRGWVCTADPVRAPCGGLTRVRLECYRTKCAAFCKA